MDNEPRTKSVGATRRIEDLRGPQGMPLFGNAFQFDRERIHESAEAWARQYGDIYRFRITSRQFVVVSDAELIATVLRDRPDGFGRTQRLSEAARALGFDGLFSANGSTWRRQRPLVLAGLDPAHIKAFFPTIVKVTERLARRWHEAADSHRSMDLQSELMRYTVDVTAGLAFGTDINTIESREEMIQEHLNQVLPALQRRLFAPVQYWKWFKLPYDRTVEKHLHALKVAVADFIGQARRRLQEHPELRERPSNLIEAMVAACDNDVSGVTDDDVSGNVLTMLLAGEDTTANTLAWMIWLLSRNPQPLERATTEVRRVLGTDRHPTRLEQVTALDYVEACAHETMRLKPVAPINTAQAVRDTVLGGVEIPAGTLVMCLTRPAGVDMRHFPEPETFDPNRWLTGAGPAAAASSAKRVSMPFGAGPRMCPGRYLALAEIKTVIGMLLGSFELDAVTTATGGDPTERMALTMSPVGLRLTLRRG